LKFTEFQPLAVVTKAPLGSQILDSVHMVLGMCTEIADELPDALDNDDIVNVGEELGDCQWYIAGYAHTWGFTLPDDVIVDAGAGPNLDPMKTIAQLQDLDKKELAYGKIAPLEERERLINLLHREIENLAYGLDIDMEAQRAKIIAKLKARYGEKFNAHGAINRDLEIERKILEGGK